MDNQNKQEKEIGRLKALYLKEKEKRMDLEKKLLQSRLRLKSNNEKLKTLREHSRENHKAFKLTSKQLVKYAADLRTIVADLNSTNRELQHAYQDTIHRLVLASEYKDQDTGNHISRMSRYCLKLAEKVNLKGQELEQIHFATPMHDVGKIGIPDSIILKNGRLTETEFNVVKTHTTIGGEILKNSRAGILKMAREIALYHHEKWNGTGYPSGLKGENIPLPARIVAICDTFDALTSSRPYKAPYPVNISCEIIKRGRGTHFDPVLTDVFLSSVDELLSIKQEIDSKSSEEKTWECAWSERDIIEAVIPDAAGGFNLKVADGERKKP